MIKEIFNWIIGMIMNALETCQYNRALNKCYRKANARIKEAQQRAVAYGYVYYVLPDNKGDFFCLNSKERAFMVKKHILGKNVDGVFLQKNAIFIARPNKVNTKREFAVTPQWLGIK